MSPSTDEALRALASPDRRRLLTALVAEDQPEEAVEVLEAVRTAERDPEKLLVELHHRHLPRLEATGLVEWDRDADRVSAGPEFDDVRDLLARTGEGGDDLASRE